MKDFKEVFITDILGGVADFMQIEVSELKAKSHRRELVFARMLVAYGLLYAGYSHPHIGRMLGRDHSTITHYKKLFFYDKMFNEHLYRFRIFMSKRGIIVPGLIKWLDELEDMGRNKRVYKAERV